MSEEGSGKPYWVPVIAAIITASAVVIAAYVGADAKRQVETLKTQKESLEKELSSIRGDLLACRQGSPVDPPKQSPRSSTSVPNDPNRPGPVPARDTQVDTGEGITFALSRCDKDDDRIKCEFVVTANEDKELMLFGNSRLIEADGTEVFASKVALGNEEVGGRLSSVARDLVRNVPIKAGISFDGVNLNATTVSLIELRCSPANARFRNVELH